MSAPSHDQAALTPGKANGTSAPPFVYTSLAGAVKEILQSGDMPDVLRAICDQACEVLGADASLIQQMSGGDRVVLHSENLPPYFVDILRQSDREHFLTNIHKSQKPAELEIIQDPGADSRLIDTNALREIGVRTLCIFSLARESGWSFGLSLYFFEPREFTGGDRETALAFGELAAVAIEKSILLEEREERAARFEVVDRISRAVASTLNPEELFRQITEEIKIAVPCARAGIAVFDKTSDTYLSLHIDSADFLGLPKLREQNAYTDWLTREIYEPKRLKNIPDIENSGLECFSPWANRGIRSALYLPILYGGICVAHLALFGTDAGAFSAENERLLTAVAGHLGTAIRNASLYKEAEERAERLEIVSNIAKAVGSELEPEELFKTIVGEIRNVIDCDRCAIARYDLREDSVFRFHEDADIPMGPMPANEGEGALPPKEVYRTKRPLNVPEIKDSEWHSSRFLKAGYRSFLVVPIVQDDECIAHIRLVSREAGAFSEEHENLLTEISAHLAPAIRNAALFRKSEERASRVAALSEVSRKISENLNLQEVLESVGHSAEDILTADNVGIFLIDEATGGLVPHVLCGRIPSPEEMLEDFKGGVGSAGHVAQSGEAVIIPDVAEWPVFRLREWARECGIHSYIATPLRDGTRVIGVIFCMSVRHDFFAGDDMEILRSLSDQAVIAIENARLHEEAQRSRVFFESIVEDNADAIHVSDINRKIILWNRGAEKLFGYSSEEALGKDFSDLIIPKYLRTRWLSTVSDRVRERGVAFHTETMRLCKDGNLVPVALTLSPVKDKNGKLIAISAMHKDLTARKSAEEALVERENRLRTILDTAVDGIITIDERGIIESINPSAQKKFGYTSAEVIGKNVSMLMPNPYKREHDTYVANYLKTGITQIMGSARELPAVKKNGEEFPIDLSVSEVWLGRRRLFTGIIRDLTERKVNEKEREEFVERLMTLNRLSQKVSTSLDLDEVLESILESTVQLMNVPYVGIFSREGDVFALRAFRGKFHAESANNFYHIGEGGVGMTVEKGSPLFIENVPEDPTWKMHRASWEHGIRTFLGVPLRSEGRIIGVLSCLTREPRIYTKGEYELINAFANMAAIMIQNAGTHSHLKDTVEELRRSQEMIIRAEKLSSLGVLAAGAAHEILNPASVILMRAEMISDDTEEGTFENKSADIIARNVRRIRTICDDLRRFSRDDVPLLEPFDPDEALKFSMELMEHELSHSGIEVNMELSDKPFIARGDSGQIQQVFVNLLSNASDAMPEGGVLTLTTNSVEAGGKSIWELRVSDTGVGIPPEILPQIFDPFFTTKSADKGTGLGLSVLHGIVKNHDGEVAVESEVDRGSTFIIRLPEAKEEVEEG